MLWKWCAENVRFFLEAFTMIRLEDGPLAYWKFNRPQAHYHNTTFGKVCKNIVLKSRQWGFSTYELGAMFHSFCFRAGYRQKVITFEDETATKLKKIVDTFYTSAKQIFTRLGYNPYDFLPYVKGANRDETGTKHEIECADTESIIAFATQGGKGSGRALTVNRMYWTEYSKWSNIGEATAGFVGSFVKDGSAIHTIDATGQGIGNAFYTEYTKARAGKSAFTPHFYGVHECGDIYSEEFLSEQYLTLGKRGPQEYPRTWEEAFLQDDNARFDAQAIEAHRTTEYLQGIMLPEEVKARPLIISCDPAEGTPNGSNTAIKFRDAESGYEALPPVVRKMTPVECAHEIKRVFDAGYFGLIVPERNNDGKTVINELHHLELAQWIYRHPEPGKDLRDCKEGWPTTDATKIDLEAEYEKHLAIDPSDAYLKITSENEAIEARQYCLNPNGKRGRPLTRTDDGDRFYDDEIIASMIGLMPQVRTQAVGLSKITRTIPSIAVGSLRRDY